jgi:hypothetical protein
MGAIVVQDHMHLQSLRHFAVDRALVWHCCFVRSGKSLDSFGGLFDQMAGVSSVKAAITRSVVGSSMPSS